MNKTLTFITLALIFIACASNKKIHPQQTDNIEIVEKLFEHFNNHDWESMANLYIENAQFKDPAYGPELINKTREETINHYRGLNEIFPNIKDRVLGIYPSGNEIVAVEFVSTGTSAEGESFEIPICAILTIKDGKIVKDCVYYDNF